MDKKELPDDAGRVDPSAVRIRDCTAYESAGQGVKAPVMRASRRSLSQE